MLKELINVKIIGTLYMNKSIVTEILLQMFRRLQKFLFSLPLLCRSYN